VLLCEDTALWSKGKERAKEVGAVEDYAAGIGRRRAGESIVGASSSASALRSARAVSMAVETPAALCRSDKEILEREERRIHGAARREVVASSEPREGEGGMGRDGEGRDGRTGRNDESGADREARMPQTRGGRAKAKRRNARDRRLREKKGPLAFLERGVDPPTPQRECNAIAEADERKARREASRKEATQRADRRRESSGQADIASRDSPGRTRSTLSRQRKLRSPRSSPTNRGGSRVPVNVNSR